MKFSNYRIVEDRGLVSKIESDYNRYNSEFKKQSKKLNSVKDITEDDYPLLYVSENILRDVSICLLCKEFLAEYEKSKDVKKSLAKLEKFKDAMNIKKYADLWAKDLYYKL